jgi:taurine dioxygenase
MTFEVHHVAGALGAELGGVDVRSMDDAGIGELRTLIHEHEVVFFREVFLSDEEHLSLGRALGTPSIFPIARLLGATEPSFQRISDGPESPSEADSWHTDVTWVAEPPKYALLCAEVMPDRGGDTMWASMTAAYDALSPTMQRVVSDLRVVHDNECFVAALLRKTSGQPGAEELAQQLRREYPPVVHPLVRTHPDTGRRALFLGGHFMRRIEGMHDDESTALLEFLLHHIDAPRFHCRWRWTPGDLAIWDERSTNHRNAGDRLLQQRTIRRIEIDGDRPYLDEVSPA